MLLKVQMINLKDKNKAVKIIMEILVFQNVYTSNISATSMVLVMHGAVSIILAIHCCGRLHIF